MNKDLQNRVINTLRFLSADGVQQANSGHPGLPMGAASMAFTLWMRHMNHNPRNPHWPNRDRFILSGGHGSMLLYSMLHLTGYDLSLDELKNFRQWGSRTPGHPEYGLTPGVEVTTGPLGQGFVNGVGMAIAQSHLASIFNIMPEYPIFDHYIYAIVTDGDLMEGITSEAASLAGHLKLGKLVYLYDDNRISIEGSTDITFTESRAARFEAYGWHVLSVPDGNDIEAIDDVVNKAKKDPRPSLILCRTHIGFGMPNRQDTSKAHGEPPGDEELNGAKQKLGWPQDPRFYVPDDVYEYTQKAVNRGEQLEKEWQFMLGKYKAQYPEQANELERRLTGRLPANWMAALPVFPTDAKGMATRAASGIVINNLAASLPEIVGGSADLAPSTSTWIKDFPAFQAQTPGGRNFHFGVREHGMGAIVNGMAVYGGVIPFGSTFLTFSDYMRPTIRLSALSHYPSIWVFTHDSIGVGEDGPTHQPVEHIAALRAFPGLVVIRPADANETAAAWEIAIEQRNSPTALVFSRQAVPTLDRNIYASAGGVKFGAYVLADLGDKKPQVILMASGSEVSLIVDAGTRLAAEGINVRLVSFPSWELFAAQSQEYQQAVLPAEIKARLAVEAGISMGWERWLGSQGEMIAVNGYGASAPAKTVFQEYGFSVENVVHKVSKLLNQR